MTATEPGGRGWPPAAAVPDWPGRPTIDVPGLDRPARYCHAVATLDEPGHRQFLVIASEDGTLPTTEQLTALADGLDELHGDQAPVGSRAWLRDQLAKTRDELARVGRHESLWQQRAETAETALRDRSTVDPDGRERERLSFELARTRDAHTHQAARAAQLYREREEQATRVEELTAILEQARHERTTAAADADRYAAALTTLEQERDAARRELADRSRAGQAQADRLIESNDEVRGRLAEAIIARDGARADLRELGQRLAASAEEVSWLRHKTRAAGDEVMGLREEIRDLQEQRAELRDALVDMLRQLAHRAIGELDAERETATQTRRARSAVTAAAAALTTTAAALAWRYRR